MLTFIFLLFFQTGNAATIQSEVAEVHLSSDAKKPHLLYLYTDGIVAKIPAERLDLVEVASAPSFRKQSFEFTLDEHRMVRKMTQVQTVSETHTPTSPPEALDLLVYSPTVLPDLASATTIFDELNPYYRGRSECYNRAHVWSYEEFKKRDLRTMKVFMFFTSKYIWEYDYGWWFHVSPYVMISESGGPSEYVIDYTFMKGPSTMRNWTDYFISPKTECPVIAKYSDYENHQNASYCYLYKASMYFWQPRDIDELERTGKEKTDFIPSEVNAAYWQAF